MKVEWLNFRLTFQPESLEEHEALKAVWVAFGSQVDKRPGVTQIVENGIDISDIVDSHVIPEVVA